MNTKHLKAKILDLAIRGKLVPQDSSEGNAADLLQKSRDEKSELIKQKKIKEDKNTSFIIKTEDGKHYEQFTDGSLKDIEDEIPFEIPENWCWCKVNEIANKITDGEHNTPKRVNTFQGFYLLSARNIQNGHLSLSDVDYVDEQEFNRIFARCNPQKNDILISCSGSVGRCTRIEDDNKYVMVRSAAMISAPSISTKYLMYTIQSPELQNQIQYASKQTAQANLFQGAIANLILPLPPLSEQQRIVSAIEKAFEQIDIIEKNKLNLKTYIKQTKSKVLDLAIHGKLVEQNPQEGNAFELLEKIRNEKVELIKQKKLKEDKNASFIIKADDGKHYEQLVDGSLKDVEEEIPFEIPENWCWCKGKSIFLPMTSRLPSGNEFKYIDIETVDNKLHKVHHPKIIKTENAPSRASRETLVGDTVFSMVRPYLTNIALITEDLSDCIASTGFYICRPNKALNSVYLYYLMISDYVVNGLNQFMKGDNSPSINGDDITEFYYPLPPLSEQKRIVSAIEKAFEQLDVLEKSMGE